MTDTFKESRPNLLGRDFCYTESVYKQLQVDCEWLTLKVQFIWRCGVTGNMQSNDKTSIDRRYPRPVVLLAMIGGTMLWQQQVHKSKPVTTITVTSHRTYSNGALTR